MDIFALFTLIGGLAFFLYGMNIMGKGLETLSGSKLQGILEKMTSSPVKGVLLGAAVTAVIQSSSATTVMVVGFVNSGIMQLSQAVGVIMGANIGTTATAWILSLTSIQGESFWLQLLKPSSFTPILAMVGVVMMMTSSSNHHDSRKKDIGTILVGFSILIFGMETMSGAVQPLSQSPEFGNAGRINYNSDYTKFFCHQRDPAGAFYDWTDDVWDGDPDYYGSKHRNLCNRASIKYRSQPQRPPDGYDSSVL